VGRRVFWVLLRRTNSTVPADVLTTIPHSSSAWPSAILTEPPRLLLYSEVFMNVTGAGTRWYRNALSVFLSPVVFSSFYSYFLLAFPSRKYFYISLFPILSFIHCLRPPYSFTTSLPSYLAVFHLSLFFSLRSTLQYHDSLHCAFRVWKNWLAIFRKSGCSVGFNKVCLWAINWKNVRLSYRGLTGCNISNNGLKKTMQRQTVYHAFVVSSGPRDR
jgi:hypothetical protein